MASTPASSGHDRAEHCDRCGHETRHAVDIEIRAESNDPETSVFSREPYRVTTCARCGTERSQRMNDV